MHILLTDRLICPRCGPGFGLILLADRIEDRRVLEGRLGCANCREEYPIRNGLGDLRLLPGAVGAPPSAEPPPEAAIRLAALLGIADGAGPVLIAGPAGQLAPAIAALADGLEIATVGENFAAAEEESGVSRFLAGPQLPFASQSMRGVALSGATASWIPEAVRVLSPAGRIVVEGAAAETADQLAAAGFAILLHEDGAVVASPRRPG